MSFYVETGIKTVVIMTNKKKIKKTPKQSNTKEKS